jgi:phosphoglycerate dehydrogenase-like enzyme
MRVATSVVVLDDYQRVAKEYGEWDGLGPDVTVDFVHRHLGSQAGVIAALQDYDVICLMRERTRVPAEVIEALPRLKMLVTTGMANACLDLSAATARCVVVCGTDVSIQETAEHSFLLIANVVNGMFADVRGVANGQWQSTVGRRIHGKTLGLLGVGNLGGMVAHYAKAFGMPLLGWSQNLTAERAVAVGVGLATSIDDLFRRSDVVSIHLKLSDRTRGVVTGQHLRLLGPEGYLVNTSRGPIVVEDDLVQALRGGVIAGAALDTFDIEPLPADHPLRTEPRALVTPHSAYVSQESYRAMYRETVEDISAWLAGAPVRRLN